MIIEVNKDIETYKETVVMGLTARQLIYSILSIGAGAGVILTLHQKVGIMLSCYIATPVIIPVALAGFYSFNGMNFFELFTRFIKSLKSKPLLYCSTESIAEFESLQEIPKKGKKTKKDNKDDFKRAKKKAIIALLATIVIVIAVMVALVIYKAGATATVLSMKGGFTWV